MSPGRMEAFSDGVLAIIITIMVLELHLPESPTLASLLKTMPALFAYALSYVFVGIYWVNHHHLLKTVDRVTAGILWANLDLLFWLSLLPFATRWMALEHGAVAPVVTYGVVLGLAGTAYFILQKAIIRSQGADSKLQAALGRDIKGNLSIALFVVGVAVAFASRWAALIVYTSVAIMWLIPDRRLEPVITGGSDAEEGLDATG
jgi:uncharacterized membrane protein